MVSKKDNYKKIPLFPPYSVPEGSVKLKHGEALLPFFLGGEISSLDDLLRASIVTLLSTENGIETKILEILKKQYPNKILLPSAYMIGYHKDKIIVLDVKQYGFLAFPGGKGDGGVLSEIVDARWSELSEVLGGETQLQQIVKILRKQRMGNTNAIMIIAYLFCSVSNQSNFFTSSSYGNHFHVRSIFFKSSYTYIMNKKLGNIPEEKWLDVILTHAPETFQQILHREYQEETGRKIISSELFTVLLEEKGPNLLKVRMYYTGKVGEEDDDLHSHSHLEKVAGVQSTSMSPNHVSQQMSKKIKSKMGGERGYKGEKLFKQKKTSTAYGHYLAYMIFSLLKQKSNTGKMK